MALVPSRVKCPFQAFVRIAVSLAIVIAGFKTVAQGFSPAIAGLKACATSRFETGCPAAQTVAASGIPRRIISLIPATTEMLFAMGAGDRVVAVSNYDRFPPEATRLPRVGGLLDPDVERLLSMKPDLVIVYDTQADLKR